MKHIPTWSHCFIRIREEEVFEIFTSAPPSWCWFYLSHLSPSLLPLLTIRLPLMLWTLIPMIQMVLMVIWMMSIKQAISMPCLLLISTQMQDVYSLHTLLIYLCITPSPRLPSECVPPIPKRCLSWTRTTLNAALTPEWLTTFSMITLHFYHTIPITITLWS